MTSRPHFRFVRHAAAAIGALAVLGAASPACSKSDNNGPPDVAHFASSMAGTFCDALSACCGAAHYAYDSGSCVAQMQDLFQNAADSVKHGKVVYHPENVGTCEAAFKAQEAKCSADAGEPDQSTNWIDPLTAACWNVFVGVVPPGGQCVEAEDCAITSDAQVASCQPAPVDGGPIDPNNKVCYVITEHVAPGSECDLQIPAGKYTANRCEPHTGFCDTSGSDAGPMASGTCKAYPDVGQPCAGGFGCNPQTAYCDFQNGAKCVALKNAGDTCSGTGMKECNSGLYCDATSKTCTQLKAVGQSCKSSQECASGDCGGTPMSDAGMTCQDLGGRGSDWDISPRTCGFGPFSNGPEDAGIAPPATQSLRTGTSRNWWRPGR